MDQKPQPSTVQPEPNPNQPSPVQPNTAQPKPVAPNNSKTVLIIVIVVGVLLVFGVGGYFAWRYLGKKVVDKITNKTTEITTNQNTNKVSAQSVIDALMYPGSKISDQKQGSESSVYAIELTLSSSADVTTIKNYYIKLANDNKWKITRQGSSYDDNFYLTVVSSDFTAEIDITRHADYDTTDIYIYISGDKLASEGISISAVPSSGTSSVASSNANGNTNTTATTSQSGSDYIISDSNTRVVSKSELTGLTPWKLKVARNEIYARHGRPFVHKDLQCYFATKSWYAVDNNYDVSSVTYTENKNIATIQAYEQETNSPLASTDSGCNTNQ